MISKTVTYMNFDDEKVTETCWFNISKSELAGMASGPDGGLKAKIERIIASQNKYEILALIKEIVLFAYGEKTPDGRSFMKTPEITKRFECSIPYDMIYTSLFSDAKAFADFVKGTLPKDILSDVNADGLEVKDLPIGVM